MTKDEYLKTLQKEEDDNAQEAEDNGYGSGYYDGLDYAIDLVEQLEELKKVVIPQFVADWIEKYDKCLIEYPAFIVHYVVEDCGLSAQDDWLDSRDNQKLLLNAIANGYEVENKIEKYVRLKGFKGTTCYLNYDITFEEFFVDTTELDSCTKVKFTKSWLKDNWSEYEAYNNAGLLEFREAEDD